jgi:hypothetical protein
MPKMEGRDRLGTAALPQSRRHVSDVTGVWRRTKETTTMMNHHLNPARTTPMRLLRLSEIASGFKTATGLESARLCCDRTTNEYHDVRACVICVIDPPFGAGTATCGCNPRIRCEPSLTTSRHQLAVFRCTVSNSPVQRSELRGTSALEVDHARSPPSIDIIINAC